MLLAMLTPTTMIVVAVIALLLFGNRLPSVMRDLGKGVSEFKKGIDSIGEPIDEVKSLGRDVDNQIRK